MLELESSLHSSMTFQPFAALATSKKDAVSTMIYTNNQIPKFTGFFSPFHVLPLMLQPPHAGAITALVKGLVREHCIAAECPGSDLALQKQEGLTGTVISKPTLSMENTFRPTQESR